MNTLRMIVQLLSLATFFLAAAVGEMQTAIACVIVIISAEYAFQTPRNPPPPWRLP